MSVKSLFITLAILLATLTFFSLDTVADTESVSDDPVDLWVIVLVIVLIVICIWLATRKERAFLKTHSNLLSSEDPKVLLELTENCYEFLRDRRSDKVASLALQAKVKIDDIYVKEFRDLLSSTDPKVLLELAEKCEEYLKDRQSDEVASLALQAKVKIDDIYVKEFRDLLSSTDPKVLLELAEKCEEYLKDRQSDEVASLAQLAKAKAARIQKEIDLETFRSEISEDGSHPAIVSTLKERLHNPDSFQHVSSDYEIVEKDGKFYHKIVMTFRATNTYNALVLQTCYFVVNADNQVSLVGSPDSSESSPVTTAPLAASADAATSEVDGVAALADATDAAVGAVEDVATLADLLSLFTSDEE